MTSLIIKKIDNYKNSVKDASEIILQIKRKDYKLTDNNLFKLIETKNENDIRSHKEYSLERKKADNIYTINANGKEKDIKMTEKVSINRNKKK